MVSAGLVTKLRVTSPNALGLYRYKRQRYGNGCLSQVMVQTVFNRCVAARNNIYIFSAASALFSQFIYHDGNGQQLFGISRRYSQESSYQLLNTLRLSQLNEACGLLRAPAFFLLQRGFRAASASLSL